MTRTVLLKGKRNKMPRLELPQITCSDTDVHRTDFKLGLWRISEDEEHFFDLCPELMSFSSDLSDMKSTARRLEYLAVRALLHDITGTVPKIFHNVNGKPSIQGIHSISISHTKCYASVILSDKYNVAVDIEYISERVCRITEKFLRMDEHPVDTVGKLLCWCAKETLYKLHSDDKLAFDEMRCFCSSDGTTVGCGSFHIENLKRGVTLKMNYIVTETYVMTYAIEKSR